MYGEDAIVCAICEKEETDVNKVIECTECHRYWHTKCKKLFGSTARRARANPYLCSAECKEMSSCVEKEKKAEDLINKVLDEVHGMRRENEATRNELKKAMNDVEHSQSFLAGKFDDMKTELIQLKQGQFYLKERVDDVQEKYDKVNSTVEKLEKEVDQFNRSYLRKNAVILGVPVLQDENILGVVKAIAAAMDCELAEDSILEAKRMGEQKQGGKIPVIKVVFANEEIKEKLLARKQTFGQLSVSALGANYASASGRIIVRDELTKHGVELLNEVRELQSLLELKYVWPGRDGVILVRRTDNAKVEYVRDREDIRKLSLRKSKRNAVNLEDSHGTLNMSTSSSSPPIEQLSKRR